VDADSTGGSSFEGSTLKSFWMHHLAGFWVILAAFYFKLGEFDLG